MQLRFIIINKILLTTLTVIPSLALTVEAQTIAFPGAEGFGRFAQGGRGGDVYHVTQLKDEGVGSLRYGIEKMNGPRTIVFDVSGTIELNRTLNVKKPFLTIAGQTAPGDGITLKDHTFKVTDTHDIILRYIRFRTGDENKLAGSGAAIDGITTNGVSNIIFDHISASWAIDGTHDLRGEKFTLQWSIYGEALNHSLHEKGEHAMLASFRDLTDHITLHHNLMHSSRNRHPTLGGGNKTNENSIVDFRNNVVFNWQGPTNLGSCRMNLINNYYKPGKSTNTNDKPMQVKAPQADKSRGYSAGNVFPWNETWTRDNFLAIEYENSGNYGSTTREAFELKQALVVGDDQPETHTAEESFEMVLQYAGASKKRDAVDLRIVSGVKDGSNRLIDSQAEVGGWPKLQSLPAPQDTDQDGMPDKWERKYNLDPKNPNDRNDDRNNDGYTNLEEYLNSLAVSN